MATALLLAIRLLAPTGSGFSLLGLVRQMLLIGFSIGCNFTA